MASGLQKQVLSLYRKCLRAAIAKPMEHRAEAVDFVRREFRQGAREVKRNQFRVIEFMIRSGEKQLKIWSRSGAKGFAKIEVAPKKDESTST